MESKVLRARNLTELFILFCFCGWIYEVIWCNIIESNMGWQNNGYLWGPWLPIYGFGMSLVLYIQHRLDIHTPGKIFISGTLIVTAVEFIGGCIAKSVVGKPLWDYSDLWGNFQGIIAVKTSIMFGLLILLGIYVILPKFTEAQEKYSTNKVRNILSIIVLAVFFVDVLLRLKYGSNI